MSYGSFKCMRKKEHRHTEMLFALQHSLGRIRNVVFAHLHVLQVQQMPNPLVEQALKQVGGGIRALSASLLRE